MWTKVYHWMLFGCITFTVSIMPSRAEDCTLDGFYKIPRFGADCQYRCRCVDDTQCDRDTGSCAFGCAFGWMGPGCQYRNLAQRISNAEQSEDHSKGVEAPWLAFDGNNSTCSKSYNSENSVPWWRIEFPTEVYIVGFVIIIPESFIESFNNFRIEGGDDSTFTNPRICYQQNGNPLAAKLEIMCTAAMTSKHIRIIQTTSSQSLELCEVEIYGGRYVSYKARTQQTDTFQPWKSNASFAVDGRPMLPGDEQEADAQRTCATTASGMRKVWMVFFPTELLVHGIDVYGRRLIENPERLGQIARFTVYIDNQTTVPVYHDDPPGADSGAYQPRALELAVPRLGNQVEIWKNPTITEHLSLCEVEVFAECTSGLCGWSCTDICQCANVTTGLARKEGLCPYGCKPRWTGQGGRCNTECADNQWGPACVNVCHCFEEEPCDFYSGTCQNGCDPGWKTRSCNIACDSNQYGQGCLEDCGQCADGQACHVTTGVCPGACAPGWQGPLCQDPCPDLTYGPGCNLTCGDCKRFEPCNKQTGFCVAGCIAGLAPPLCTDSELLKTTSSEQESSSGTTYAAAAISVAIMVIIAVVAVLIVRRKRNIGNPKSEETIRSTAVEKNIAKTDVHSGTDLTVEVEGKADNATTTTESCDNVYVNSGSFSAPIAVSKLKQYCHTMKLDPSPLFEDFKELPHGRQFETSAALTEINRNKNRYKEIYPYDKNRVVLQTAPTDSEAGYINASYMTYQLQGPLKALGYTLTRRYIAAQGALKTTVDDVWRMIWAHDVSIVVMLTGCVEQGRNKCELYWPEEEDSNMYGDIEVTRTLVDVYAEHTTRTFEINKECAGNAKRVTQYHFTGWPDKDVPDDTLSLVQFWRLIKNSTPAVHSPWMVHCSAGIGRTGTFIALDYLYDQGIDEQTVDVKRCVHQLRDQRVNMVQTKDQYLFVHQAVYEALNLIGETLERDRFKEIWRSLQKHADPTIYSDPNNSGTPTTSGDPNNSSTSTTSGDPNNSSDLTNSGDPNNSTDPLNSGAANNSDVILLEYEALSVDAEDYPDGHEYATFNTVLSKDDFSDSRKTENTSKSRNMDILPPDRYRPRLSVPVEDCNDYINAVCISTFRMKDGLILSQLPLEHTVVDCLRLIWQYRINTVVLMEKEVPENCSWWPNTVDSPRTVGPFTLLQQSEELGSSVIIHRYSVKMDKQGEQREVALFHFQGWSGDKEVPDASGAMLELISSVETSYRRSDSNGPILVQCLDGASRSGLFAMVWSVIERIKTERTISIAQTVRQMRTRRKQIVPSYEQYRHCWAAVAEYLDSVEVYGNVM